MPLPGFIHTITPHHYHGAEPGESEEAFATRCADELEKLIVAEGPDTVAAMFAEPVMGAGGVIVPPRTYFEKIQAVLRKYDVLLVADEVICGFGRTGNYWGTQTFGMEPDIITCAKALSSSYLPISAVMVNETRVRRAGRREPQDRHVRARLHLFRPPRAGRGRDRDAQDLRRDGPGRARLERRRVHAETSCAAASPDHELVGEVRGVGMVGAIELVADRDARRNFDAKQKVGRRLAKLCEAHGVIARSLPNDTLAFSPPIIMTQEEVSEMLDRVGRALDELAVQVRRERLAVVA